MSVAWVPERKRISVDRYQLMVTAGVLTKYDRVELIDGELVDMAPIGVQHAAITARLTKLFVLSAPDAATVSPGGSVVLGDYSQPQPDLMLLQPREDFYSGKNPTAADVFLVVEISNSSLAVDLGIKRTLYARSGIAEYWVVDIPGKCVHVFNGPTVDGYLKAVDYGAGDRVSPWALPAVQVRVEELFA